MENSYYWYVDCTDSEAIYQHCYCIQTNARLIQELDIGSAVWERLDERIIREIEPLKHTNFVAHPNLDDEMDISNGFVFLILILYLSFVVVVAGH